MEYILYFFRFLYRIRWWLLVGTGIITILVYYATRNLPRTYNVEATVYTGVVSGYTIEGTGNTDWAATTNAMDNLINIIRAESTLKKVSYRLYARNMINGDPEKDNTFLKASSYREIYNRTKNNWDGPTLLALIDKNSETETVKNMERYERPDKDNFIYGLYYWYHWHYSHKALEKINVSRKGNSDLLQISYSSDDPGIAFNTLEILLEEFVNEYRAIRYGETDKVIEYFRSELTRIGNELRNEENDLTDYNVEKRIINYYDETKEIAAINKEFELREQNVLLAYNGSRAMLEELEKQLEVNLSNLKTNAQFVNSLNKVSSLTGKIAELETFSTNTDDHNNELEAYKSQLNDATVTLNALSEQYVLNQHSKEGMAKSTILEQWLEQLLLFEEAKAQLDVIQKSRQDLLDKYTFYAPVGSEIKRKERKINFTEQSYLAVLHSYNEALMRKKNLEMTSATLKVLNPPAFPIAPEASARRKIVLMAFLASLAFIFGFFLFIEIFDRTLRDRVRGERVTGGKILGAFPNKLKLKYRNYNKTLTDISTKFLSSTILGFFTAKKDGKPYIVNFLSTNPSDGKTYLSENLEDYWKGLGINVRRISWDTDFDINDRKYLLSENIHQIYPYTSDDDILIVEYPNLGEYSIPNSLLEEADINLLVVRANRAWKDSDKNIYEKLKKQVGVSPLYFYLDKTSREATETFTGMLPPYTYLRKLGYKISQLGLTEEMNKSPEGEKKQEEDN